MNDRIERWLTEHTQSARPWLVLFAVLLALQISPWWYPTPDSVLYLSMARRVAAGAPVTALGSRQLALPPGYAVLISPAFLFSARPFLALSILQWILGVLLMLGVYRWMRRQSRDAAVLLTGLVMLHVSVWIHYRRALSEIAFMALMIWTVLAAERALAGRSWKDMILRTLPVSIGLLGLSMIREVGIVFAAGFALAAFQRGPRERMGWGMALLLSALVALPAAGSVLAFARYDAAMKAQAAAPMGTHLDGVRAATAALGENGLEAVRVRISEIGRVLIPGMFKAYGRPGDWFEPSMMIYLPVFFVVVWGWWKIARTRAEVLALSLPLYLGVHLLWPFDAGTRYVLPMLPILLACVWAVVEPLRRQRLSILAMLLALHLGVAAGYWLAIDVPRARACDAEWPAVEALTSRIGSGPAVVGAGVPSCVQLMIELSLDRLVRESNAISTVDAGVEWIVMPAGEPPPGFVRQLSAGEYLLLARERPS